MRKLAGTLSIYLALAAATAALTAVPRQLLAARRQSVRHSPTAAEMQRAAQSAQARKADH